MKRSLKNKNSVLLPLLYILVGIPAVNILNIFAPYSKKFLFEADMRYFNSFWISVIIIQLSGLLLSIYFVRRYKFSFSEFGYVLNKKQTITTLLTIVVFFILSIITIEILLQKNISISCYIPDKLSRRIVYCLSLLNAGIAEEFMFRAYGLTMLKKLKVPVWLAIIITTVSFTLIHGMAVPVNYIQYLVFGVLMALLFVWKKNILYCISIHILWNFFTVFYCFIF